MGEARNSLRAIDMLARMLAAKHPASRITAHLIMVAADVTVRSINVVGRREEAADRFADAARQAFVRVAARGLPLGEEEG